MSQAELLEARNTELMALIQGFRETVITEFFTCPECQSEGGINACVCECEPFDINCSCYCGHKWVAQR